jgi:hypothetical protein
MLVADCAWTGNSYAAIGTQPSDQAVRRQTMAKTTAGDKIIRDDATVNLGKLHIGDNAPAFRAGAKVIRDSATTNDGKVQLGDNAPAFRAGAKVIRDSATTNDGKVQLGDNAPAFSR